MRQPLLRVGFDELVVDNFAGGGGASTGIAEAIGRDPDIAINHDEEALAMHAANHPGTRHLHESVWDIDPTKVCGGKPVALAWFSPDCTYHSIARGGKPHRDRNRARRVRGLAWVAVRWAKAVRPRLIAVENVQEFEGWGPLLPSGQPDPARRGSSFGRWCSSLRNLGYNLEFRTLVACDHGAPTSRKRLFVIARRDGEAVVWPKASHGPGTAKPFRTAAECIEWDIPCPSIFERERPLAENTLRRIARGIRRYVVESAAPFIIPMTHTQRGWRADSILEPVRTVTGAHRGELALCAPTLIQRSWGERPGQAPRCMDIGKPLGTVVGGGVKHALVAAFLARHYGGHQNDGQDARRPMHTVTTIDHHALVTSHLLKFYGTSSDGAPVSEPMPTVTANDRGGGHIAEVRAFLMAYYRTDNDAQLGLPLQTIPTHDRFSVVVVAGAEYVISDIGMRMLTPRELFRAQGFPDEYRIDQGADGRRLTKTAQTRLCGNSVPPPVARAIIEANLGTLEAVAA